MDRIDKEVRIEVREQRDVITARARGRALARTLGLGITDQTRLVTAISEVARNAVQYAGSGECILRDESDERHVCISVEVVDHGPGIEDIDQAMADGYSTAPGLGAGLSGARRITSEFQIESRPGFTCVSFRIKRSRHSSKTLASRPRG